MVLALVAPVNKVAISGHRRHLGCHRDSVSDRVAQRLANTNRAPVAVVKPIGIGRIDRGDGDGEEEKEATEDGGVAQDFTLVELHGSRMEARAGTMSTPRQSISGGDVPKDAPVARDSLGKSADGAGPPSGAVPPTNGGSPR